MSLRDDRTLKYIDDFDKGIDTDTNINENLKEKAKKDLHKSMKELCNTKYVCIADEDGMEYLRDEPIPNPIQISEISNCENKNSNYENKNSNCENVDFDNDNLVVDCGLPINDITEYCEWKFDNYASDPSGVFLLNSSNTTEGSTQLLRIPVIFKEEFGKLDDGNTIYGVIIDTEMMYKTRKEIESILFDRGFCCEKSKLSDTISAIIAHDREAGTMSHSESYECIGVHYNIKDKSKLTVAYPQIQDIRIIPQDANPLFEDSMNEVLKYDIDDSHKIIEPFFDALSTFDNNIVAIASGWSFCSPFFYVLRNTKMDVFPMLIMHGNSGTGKSKLLELLTMMSFGMNPRSAMAFDSNFRFDAFRAISTVPITIEEMDDTNDDVKSSIKSSAASSVQGSFRGTSTQQVMTYRTRTPIVITSNSGDLWEGDTAIREGRSLFIDIDEKIYSQDNESIETYKNAINEIVSSNKLFGYFFLKEIVNIMNDEKADTNSKYLESVLDNSIYIDAIGRLTHVINANSNTIRNELLEVGAELADDRRYTIWGLVKTGLIFQHHVFSIKDENGEMLSARGASYIEELLDSFVDNVIIPNQRQLETTQIAILEDLIVFITTVTMSSPNSNKYEDARNALFTNDRFGTYKIDSYCLSKAFVGEYNKWARQTGAKHYKSVKSIADEISSIFDLNINRVYKAVYNPTEGIEINQKVTMLPIDIVDSAMFERLSHYKTKTNERITMLDLMERVSSKTNSEINEILKQ